MDLVRAASRRGRARNERSSARVLHQSTQSIREIYRLCEKNSRDTLEDECLGESLDVGFTDIRAADDDCVPSAELKARCRKR